MLSIKTVSRMMGESKASDGAEDFEGHKFSQVSREGV